MMNTVGREEIMWTAFGWLLMLHWRQFVGCEQLVELL